ALINTWIGDLNRARSADESIGQQQFVLFHDGARVRVRPFGVLGSHNRPYALPVWGTASKDESSARVVVSLFVAFRCSAAGGVGRPALPGCTTDIRRRQHG
ncbi:MAG: hypothetical protein LC808_25855, partial [Actinobacteria bacterium]|nr:hypothetical protein [Actinomycetota bacterium]